VDDESELYADFEAFEAEYETRSEAMRAALRDGIGNGRDDGASNAGQTLVQQIFRGVFGGFVLFAAVVLLAPFLGLIPSLTALNASMLFLMLGVLAAAAAEYRVDETLRSWFTAEDTTDPAVTGASD
jgi:hypothetical protein